MGTSVRGSAYPNSKYNGKVVSVLDRCGIAYARGGDQTGSFAMPRDWLRLMPTARHTDPDLFALGRKFLELSPSSGEECALFTLMGHSYEFDRDDNWQVIESFAQMMGGHSDIWYATLLEIDDYVQAWQALSFAPTEKTAHNPSATGLWFVKDGKEYCVPAGQSLRLDCE